MFQSDEDMFATLSDGKDRLVIYAEKERRTTNIVVEYWPSDGEFKGTAYSLANTTTRQIADTIYDSYEVNLFELI